MDLFPLYNSIRISLISSVFTLILGVLFAFYITKLPRGYKGVLDALLTIPMVLPPTVVGFILLMFIAPNGLLGSIINEYFGITLTMTWYSSIFAVIIITFPIMYRTARGSFEQLDKNLIYAGKTLGLKNSVIFRKIILPNCRTGIVAGFVLSFARGLGEYGATSMVSGFIQNSTATISTTVAYYWQTGQDSQAMFWVMINLVISFAVMLTVNMLEKDK
ncbi:molybdate ABC transporter permease subunit [Tannockella kyphosi]|uniref:molybdate ABC transporter permease subunit n=1 Tax=Tannockella kyphosi TaxID=2899121 RepID=UPI002011B48F|nr:molybdenum ABC transporter permease [Tannockella kyphosi]